MTRRHRSSGGRPSLLDTGKREALLKAVEEGLSLQDAALLAGVAPRTAEEWRRRGEGRDSVRPSSAVYRRFAHDLELAKAKLRQSALGEVRSHAPRDPATARWLLEHLDERFTPKPPAPPVLAPVAQPQISGSNVIIIPPEDLARLGLDILHKRRLADGGSTTNLADLVVGPESEPQP